MVDLGSNEVCVNLKYSSLYGGIALVVVQNGISKRQIYSLGSHKALRELEDLGHLIPIGSIIS